MQLKIKYTNLASQEGLLDLYFKPHFSAKYYMYQSLFFTNVILFVGQYILSKENIVTLL